MSKVTLSRWVGVGAVALSVAACGGDDGTEEQQMQPVMAGTMATPPAAGMTAAGTAATGMQPDLMMIIDMFLPTCDTNISTTATCGGTACPASNQVATSLCVVPCCALDSDGAEMCGTRSADVMRTTECALPPPPGVPNENCPDFNNGMTMLEGCCMPDGSACGVISSISMACITESPFIELPATPPPCDGSGLVSQDAGTTPPASDAGSVGDAAVADAGTGDASM